VRDDDELNGHSSRSDGPKATALKRRNGDRVLVFVMGAFAGMAGEREPHLWHHRP